MRALSTVLLLVCSNVFMTWAWYGHLKKVAWTLPVAIGLSWLIALPEYALQVPANRLGHVSQGGPFTAPQLKILQEAITLTVFVGFSIVVLKDPGGRGGVDARPQRRADDAGVMGSASRRAGTHHRLDRLA
jgi:uncharacterized protein (DUF486 family)